MALLALGACGDGCGNGWNGCSDPPPPNMVIHSDEVVLRFLQPNFVGDFSAFQAANVFSINARENLTFSGTPIQIRRNVLSWAPNSTGEARPQIENITTIDDHIYVLNASASAAADMELRTQVDFIDETNPALPLTIFTRTNISTLPIERFSEVSINIDANTPVMDLTINTLDLARGEFQVVPNAFDYSVNCEVVHGNLNNQNDRMNFAIMAEGFRADQMDQYIGYVDEAFSSSENIHYTVPNLSHVHYENDFFKRYWDNINVVRFDTISPEEGIDTEKNSDTVSSIFNYNHHVDERKADMNRIKAVIDRTPPCANSTEKLQRDHLDVVILFVNGDVNAHTWTYGEELRKRHRQPVTYMIVAAPIGIDPASANLHDRVRTDAIAHELGHSLARLKDEYLEHNIKKTSCSLDYSAKYRNITIDTFFQRDKWNWFSNGLYGDAGNTYRVGMFEGGYYCDTTFYRPTLDSTMQGTYKRPNAPDITIPPRVVGAPIDATSGGIQYGPVNTYHMMASYRTRIGLEIPYDLDGFINIGIEDGEEWLTYLYFKFTLDWPPHWFQ